MSADEILDEGQVFDARFGVAPDADERIHSFPANVQDLLFEVHEELMEELEEASRQEASEELDAPPPSQEEYSPVVEEDADTEEEKEEEEQVEEPDEPEPEPKPKVHAQPSDDPERDYIKPEKVYFVGARKKVRMEDLDYEWGWDEIGHKPRIIAYWEHPKTHKIHKAQQWVRRRVVQPLPEQPAAGLVSNQ